MTRISWWTSCSSSTLAAFSMVSMSDFEPMMMPTRGASTSSSANSASTAVSVSGGAGSGVVIGDVPSELAAVERDQVGGSIRGAARGARVLAERRHVEDTPAGGDEPSVALGGARMQDLDLARDP